MIIRALGQSLEAWEDAVRRDRQHRLRGASALKLSRWLETARHALSWHDRDEPVFRDARDWMRERRTQERAELVSEIEELEAEVRRRASLAAARGPMATSPYLPPDRT